MTNGLPVKTLQTHQRQEAKTAVFSLKDWLNTTNHKQVGILYIVTAIFFMAVAGMFGEMMRTQLAVPNNNFLLPFTYDQTVTLHGLLMILWVLTPLGIGLANYIVPLQIGAKDLAFPRMNALSYWTYLFSGIMLVSSVFMPGGGPNTGWTLYAPLNTIQFTSQAGMTLAVLGAAAFLALRNNGVNQLCHNHREKPRQRSNMETTSHIHMGNSFHHGLGAFRVPTLSRGFTATVK